MGKSRLGTALKIMMGILLFIATLAVISAGILYISAMVNDITSPYIPKTVEISVPLDDLPNYLPRETKYFSVSTFGPNATLSYNFEQVYQNYKIKTGWQTEIMDPSYGATNYKTTDSSFIIKNNNLLINFKHDPTGLFPIVFIAYVTVVFTVFGLCGIHGLLFNHILIKK